MPPWAESHISYYNFSHTVKIAAEWRKERKERVPRLNGKNLDSAPWRPDLFPELRDPSRAASLPATSWLLASFWLQELIWTLKGKKLQEKEFDGREEFGRLKWRRGLEDKNGRISKKTELKNKI
ncbi:hypothetical protein ILYODFUR_026095 [Ilyodon furcidens]|uniref:Uncharacterized protein n=1 Tax=Ilyodon furcidens TaxID=33524 RepID=A0ABV0UVK6_9TELE